MESIHWLKHRVDTPFGWLNMGHGHWLHRESMKVMACLLWRLNESEGMEIVFYPEWNAHFSCSAMSFGTTIYIYDIYINPSEPGLVEV